MEERFINPVDIKQNISPEEFKKFYLKPNKPVILRGLWDDYPARKKWTIPYFKEHLGDIKVGVFDDRLQKSDRSMKIPDTEMKFADFLDVITAPETCHIKLFLFNILKFKPDMRKDFGFPPLTKLYLKKISFMFFGGTDSVVRIHQDMDWSNVFLTQLHGRKEVVLFHPRYSKLLYRYPFNVHSSVDIEHPDYKNFPGLKYVKGMHCIMEPGDTLFIPSGYWHYIKYLEGGFAINERALNPNPVFWIKGLWYVAVLSNLDDMMRYLLGKQWFKLKTNRSRESANLAISKVAPA